MYIYIYVCIPAVPFRVLRRTSGAIDRVKINNHRFVALDFLQQGSFDFLHLTLFIFNLIALLQIHLLARKTTHQS